MEPSGRCWVEDEVKSGRVGARPPLGPITSHSVIPRQTMCTDPVSCGEWRGRAFLMMQLVTAYRVPTVQGQQHTAVHTTKPILVNSSPSQQQTTPPSSHPPSPRRSLANSPHIAVYFQVSRPPLAPACPTYPHHPPSRRRRTRPHQRRHHAIRHRPELGEIPEKLRRR